MSFSAVFHDIGGKGEDKNMFKHIHTSSVVIYPNTGHVQPA
jgi:hypothetical protein